jgi:hypothetical protein
MTTSLAVQQDQDELGNIITLKFVGRRNIIGNWIGVGNHAIVFA